MKTLLPRAVVWVCLLATPLWAGELPPLEPGNIAARMNRLEAESEALRIELQRLREQPVRLPPLEATPASAGNLELAPQAGEGDSLTMPKVQAEIKKLMWTKGDFKIVPYGFLWGNMVYSTERTNPGSYTLYVFSASAQGDDEFIVDARNTRLGFDVTGPRLACFNCAPSGGKVEIDFQSSLPTAENKAAVMLRHAYWEVKDEQFRLLVGQTWDVISPLLPGMLMYSVGWDGGNIGYRRTQFRYERYLAFSDVAMLSWQGALSQNIFTDALTRGTGEPSDWPIIQMRMATTLGRRGQGCHPIVFGVSGHVGEQQFDLAGTAGPPPLPAVNDIRRRTWSLNADVRIPITERLGFQGEFFTGENLGQFVGGIGQGISNFSRSEIRATGGWLELWYDWTCAFHSHCGYSIDDPNDNDVGAGERSSNQFFYGNFVYDFTKNFIGGVEISSWRTLWVGQAPGESVRVEFVMKYGF